MRHPLLAAVLALSLVPAGVHAMVTEPNGAVVPLDPSDPASPGYDSRYHETTVRQYFSMVHETIDWRADASASPAVFSPLCSFSASLVLEQSSSRYALAWYNASSARTTAPSSSELHTIVPANSMVGTVATSADIRSSHDYAGGLVGFALVGGQTHFTEARWDVNCSGCSTPGPWVTALVYRSVVHPNAYYVAFEDGSVTSSGQFNNDGDFNDAVFLVTGVQCDGEGTPCSTGQMGVCGDGLNECDAHGTLQCRPANTARAETCDGLDNDCNGTADDADGLCAAGSVCEQGRCVPRCVEGSCFEDQVCTSRGTCVETACATITCPTGLRCAGGTCASPCDGVRCPGAQVCREGLCVDPCAGVTCGENKVCAQGVCVESCTCSGCAGALACGTDGHCIATACAGVDCDTGSVCIDGHCVDACDGAHCPDGQSCSAGVCVAIVVPGPEAGVMDATTVDSGTVAAVDAGANAIDGGNSPVRDAGTTRGADGGRHADESGCACRAGGPGQRGSGGSAWAMVWLAGAVGRRGTVSTSQLRKRVN